MCLHVPLAGLLCWSGRAGMAHGTKLCPIFALGPGQLSLPGGWGEQWLEGAVKAVVLDVYWGRWVLL